MMQWSCLTVANANHFEIGNVSGRVGVGSINKRKMLKKVLKVKILIFYKRSRIVNKI